MTAETFDSARAANRRRVVIVGGGVGGLSVGRWLWALAARDRRELSISETAQIAAGHAFSENGAASPRARAVVR